MPLVIGACFGFVVVLGTRLRVLWVLWAVACAIWIVLGVENKVLRLLLFGVIPLFPWDSGQVLVNLADQDTQMFFLSNTHDLVRMNGLLLPCGMILRFWSCSSKGARPSGSTTRLVGYGCSLRMAVIGCFLFGIFYC